MSGILERGGRTHDAACKVRMRKKLVSYTLGHLLCRGIIWCHYYCLLLLLMSVTLCACTFAGGICKAMTLRLKTTTLASVKIVASTRKFGFILTTMLLLVLSLTLLYGRLYFYRASETERELYWTLERTQVRYMVLSRLPAGLLYTNEKRGGEILRYPRRQGHL